MWSLAPVVGRIRLIYFMLLFFVLYPFFYRSGSVLHRWSSTGIQFRSLAHLMCVCVGGGGGRSTNVHFSFLVAAGLEPIHVLVTTMQTLYRSCILTPLGSKKAQSVKL